MDEILYKYRGINGFRFFTDIILKNRLFAAKYSDLNDPMEGHYYYNKGELNTEVRDSILKGKNQIKICSLSRIRDNELMWSHYAEGHRGVAIGLKVNRDKYNVRPIEYDGPAFISGNNMNSDSVIQILSRKLEIWSYEEEERVFITDNKMFVDVEVVQIITGRAMSNPNFSFLRDLIKKINPSIEIIKADTFM